MNLDPATQNYIVKIFRAYLPAGTSVYAYGSRATNSNKAYSDLDILIESPVSLESKILEAISEIFTASDLTFKVDIHEAHLLTPEFLKNIEDTKVLLLKTT